MIHTKTVYVAYTNTDCTEGRGSDVPIAVCRIEATAKRMARGQYVQGSDGPVRAIQMIEVEGRWYLPSHGVSIIEPSEADIQTQNRLDSKAAAIDKAKAAGLTDDDIKALRS